MQTVVFYLWYMTNGSTNFYLYLCVAGPVHWVTQKNDLFLLETGPFNSMVAHKMIKIGYGILL